MVIRVSVWSALADGVPTMCAPSLFHLYRLIFSHTYMHLLSDLFLLVLKASVLCVRVSEDIGLDYVDMICPQTMSVGNGNQLFTKQP